MNVNPLTNLNLNLYSYECKNGLKVYIVPDSNNNNIYATFSSNFGSRICEFVPINKNKMIKVPLGVAHFLEHKAFEQEDGIDPFTYFSERGADANANTSYYKTTYLFSGPNFFEDNLNLLLDYVQKPYFTDENVEKEKGIIIQEYQMYQDRPFTRCYEGLIKNAFLNDPIKYPVIGTSDSIKSITKENLYDCYNTFYHPANMFVIVTGNVNPEEVKKIIDKNQEGKQFDDFKNPQVKKYKEPNKVEKEYEEIKMDVTIPKVIVGYKLDITKLKKYPRIKIFDYISLLFDILFGCTSIANEHLKTNNIISGDVSLDYINTENHILFMVASETNNKNEFIKYVDEVLNNFSITEEELNRKKKCFIGSIVAMSNNIFSVNNKFMNNIITYGDVICDDYDIIESLNINEFNNVINELDFNNKTVFVVNSKKKV